MYWHIRGMHLTALEQAQALLQATDSAEPSADRAGTLLSLGLAQWTLGRVDEANETWHAAFEQASAVNHDGLRSRAAFCLGAGFLGLDPAEARRWAGEGASIGEQSGDRWAFAFARGFEAFAEAILANVDVARSKFEEALGIQLELGDHEGEGFALAGLAFLETQAGALDAAIELYERSRIAYATIGDRAEEARVLGEMAWVYLASGEIAGARRRFLDAIAAYEDVASGRGVGLALVGLVAAEVADGRHERAVQLAAAAERLVGEEGIANVYQSSPQGVDHLEAATAALTSDAAERARVAGRDMSLEQAVALAALVEPPCRARGRPHLGICGSASRACGGCSLRFRTVAGGWSRGAKRYRQLRTPSISLASRRQTPWCAERATPSPKRGNGSAVNADNPWLRPAPRAVSTTRPTTGSAGRVVRHSEEQRSPRTGQTPRPPRNAGWCRSSSSTWSGSPLSRRVVTPKTCATSSPSTSTSPGMSSSASGEPSTSSSATR